MDRADARELEGVRYQVDQNLLEASLVRHDHFWHVDRVEYLELEVLSLHLEAEHLINGFH